MATLLMAIRACSTDVIVRALAVLTARVCWYQAGTIEMALRLVHLATYVSVEQYKPTSIVLRISYEMSGTDLGMPGTTTTSL